MTALAFILGVVPLVIASGAGAAARRSLGTAVFGGMLVATLLSLVLVPALFVIVQGAAEWVRRGLRGSGPRQESERRKARDESTRSRGGSGCSSRWRAAAANRRRPAAARGDRHGGGERARCPDRREYVGNVRAMNAVDVRARVRGYLIEQPLHRGPARDGGRRCCSRSTRAPIEVALAEAKRRARARARGAERARREFARAEELVRDERAPSLARSTRGAPSATATEAEIAERRGVASPRPSSTSRTARCARRSGGRIGRALVDVGNLVGESGQDTVLAKIVQVDPIHVVLRADRARPARRAARRRRKAAFPRSARANARRARARRRHDLSAPRRRSTTSTRPSSRRAARSRCAHCVPNPDGVLKPGEFVRVVAVFPDYPDAMLVPERAVLEEQGGSYVLVVGDDSKVAYAARARGQHARRHAADRRGAHAGRARDRGRRAEGAARDGRPGEVGGSGLLKPLAAASADQSAIQKAVTIAVQHSAPRSTPKSAPRAGASDRETG